jgi:hypothetical protein
MHCVLVSTIHAQTGRSSGLNLKDAIKCHPSNQIASASRALQSQLETPMSSLLGLFHHISKRRELIPFSLGVIEQPFHNS